MEETRTVSRTRRVVLLFLVVALSAINIASSEQQEIYGTQCSFAITSETLDGCDPEMLDHRQKFYTDYMKGCYHYYSKEDCNEEEEIRLAMNQRQPQSMVNMTATGYQKLKAPESLLVLLKDFWEANKEGKYEEDWGHGSIYTNHWEAPTYMVSVENDHLKGGGPAIKKAIWDAALDGVAEWTGGLAKLRPVSLYGIREYTEGAVLSPHVDRVPLVSSGIVNVAQDVDEPWPLEVYDRNGQAQNITMEPGDMILYESHSLIHGRPFPLKGRFYANIFIHFEPFDGWDTARDKTHLGDNNGDLPPYILPGSPEEENFRMINPNGWSKYFAEGEEPPVGSWASMGNLEKLKEVAALDARVLSYEDENGWAPIHEAIRAGHHHIVAYLVENGADINDLTIDGTSPLRVAINDLGPSHMVTKYLQDLGAEDHGDVIDERNLNDDGGDDEGHYDDDEEDDDGGHFFGDSNNADEHDHPGEDIVPSIVNNNPGDVVPTIVKIEEEIVPTTRRIGETIAEKTPDIVPTIRRIGETIAEKTPEIVPTIRRIGETIAEKTPEIVPTIVGTDDIEEL